MSRILCALGAIAAVTLSACGSSGAGGSAGSSATSGRSAPSASSRPARVVIAGYAFRPPSLTVHAGTRVSFIDRDGTAHTATSKLAGAFDTGTVAPGRSATVTLRRPGTYAYYCQFHAFMTGTITVVR